MKKLFIIIALFSMAGFSACRKQELLDPVITNDLNIETTFVDSARTIDFLAGIYNSTKDSWGYLRMPREIRAGTAECADEAVHRLNGATQPFVYVLTGNLSAAATVPYEDVWIGGWRNIRRANVLLANIDNVPVSAALKKQVKGEVRFLRAWYYASLVKNFGGVPLLGDKVFTPSDDLLTARATYEECISYIASQLDEAVNDVPLTHQAQDYGRATKGACLALKSRVLLYAASPLFNGGGIAKEEPVRSVTGYPAFSADRWKLAADAAKAVIDLGKYNLVEDNVTAPGYGFSRVFLTRVNPEYIYAGMLPPNKEMENYALPPSRGNTQPQSVPTQNMVEAFGMRNGKAITDPSSGYNPADPYINRDPRFNYSIIYNGSLWYLNTANSKQPLFTYELAPQDGYKTITWATGYYWRKMMDENTARTGGSNTERCLPLIRYAEILLNYAEASNEMGNTAIAYDQLKIIRKRAGIIAGADGLYGLKANMTVAEMREAIMAERRVELAYEDHRYWDVRRWKTAPVTMNAIMYAMRITRPTTNPVTYAYEKVVVNVNAQHVFREANYLFPIMQSEISKNAALIQNPGY